MTLTVQADYQPTLCPMTGDAMGSMEIEFHATRDELADYVEQWMADDNIYAIAKEFPPLSAELIDRTDVRAVFMRPRVRALVFTEGPPVGPISGDLAFMDRNPGALVLDVGRLTPRGLEGSSLTTLDAKPRWKQLGAFVKKRTKAGAMVIHEETGAKGFDRNQRYTPGAKALAETGVAMRQFAQTPSLYFFGNRDEFDGHEKH